VTSKSIVLAVWLAIPAAAWADPRQADIAKARKLFDEARAAEDREDWPAAEEKLRSAIVIKETAGLRFHLAYCQEHRGMLVEAMADYDRASELALGRDEDVARQTAARREELKKRTPTLTVIADPNVGELSLALDGHPFSAALVGKPIPQNPGAHHVTLSAPGRRAYAADVTLAAGDAIVMTAAIPPEGPALTARAEPTPAGPTEPIPPPSGGGGGRAFVLATEAAVTAISLGIGIGYAISASSANSRMEADREKLDTAAASPDEADKACQTGAGNADLCEDLQAAYDRWHHHRFLSEVGFIGASVGAAAFAATWILWPARRHPQQAIAPFVSAQATGISFAGQF
jgi:hypothetical protein